MKKALTIGILIFFLLSPLLAKAQPTPPDVPTLGPVIIYSAGDSGNFVKITSLENQTTYPNPIQLNFNTQQITLMGQSYNIGYSIDGGSVTSVTNSVSRSIDNSDMPDKNYYKSKAIGNLILPTLSEGFHRIIVYIGWQYIVTNHPELDRFDVFAYATVEFLVGNPESSSPTPTQTPSPSPTQNPTPTPSIPEFSWLIILPLFIFVLSIAVIVRLRKNWRITQHKTYSLLFE
jgi:hypothetical protein